MSSATETCTRAGIRLIRTRLQISEKKSTFQKMMRLRMSNRIHERWIRYCWSIEPAEIKTLRRRCGQPGPDRKCMQIHALLSSIVCDMNSMHIVTSSPFLQGKRKKCCEVGPGRSHKIRLFSPLLTLLFYEHWHQVFGVLLYAISESCDTDFAGKVVYKPDFCQCSLRRSCQLQLF